MTSWTCIKYEGLHPYSLNLDAYDQHINERRNIIEGKAAIVSLGITILLFGRLQEAKPTLANETYIIAS